MISAIALLLAFPSLQSQEPLPGEKLDPSAYAGGWIETMAEVVARENARTEPYPEYPRGRNGAQGTWTIPSLRWTSFPHSGEHYAAVKWGDTRIGIGFRQAADLQGVWLARHMHVNARTTGVRPGRYLGARQGRATRCVDERTGRMLTMKNPCIILEDIVCEGAFQANCPREFVCWWREIWLERAS